MTKAKKKLSKTAKAALKVLEESKLMAASKVIIGSKADQTFKAVESSVKPTTMANKMRPNKKRG